MLKKIAQLTSLFHFAKRSLSGQIATFLILVMMAVLVFILVTVNLGQVSVTTTNLANAVDSATLGLASNIGSKANYYRTTLKEADGGHYSEPPPQRCYKGPGMFAIVMALVGAGIGLYFGFFVLPAMLPSLASVGTIAGAAATAAAGGTVSASVAMSVASTMAVGTLAATAGGAIGGAIGGLPAGGSGAMQGAFQGAMAGAALGGGFGLGVGVGGAAAVGLGGAAVSSAVLAGGAIPAAVITGATIGAALAVGLSAGASVYMDSVSSQMRSAAFAAAARQMRSMPEHLAYIAGAALQVLSQVVDDPTKYPDIEDLDKDGDTDELVPRFQVQWSKYIKALNLNLFDLFLNWQTPTNEHLNEFKDYAKGEVAPGGGVYEDNALLHLSDGPLVKLSRGLWFTPYRLPEDYWIHPSARTPEKKADLIDRTRFEFDSYIGAAEGGTDSAGNTYPPLIPQEQQQQYIGVQNWFSIFYPVGEAAEGSSDNSDGSDYYSRFKVIMYGDPAAGFEGLTDMKADIEATKMRLPDCNVGGAADPLVGAVLNPPCKGWFNDRLAATTDNFLATDEFKEATDKIDEMTDKIKEFQHNMDLDYDAAKPFLGGLDPVTYTWKDTRGEHSVSVAVMIPIMMPKIVKTDDHGFFVRTICLKEKHYNGLVGVIATRTDPANQPVQAGKVVLGRYNPTTNQTDKFQTITRSSFAWYSYDRVGMIGKGGIAKMGLNLLQNVTNWAANFLNGLAAPAPENEGDISGGGSSE